MLAEQRNEPAAEARERHAVVVLGMHRSGTSALTRVLNLLGCALPENLVGAGRSNVTGHWEPLVINQVDGRMLEAAGSRWDDWQPFDPAWLSESTLRDFRREAVKAVRDEYGDAALIALKDPRICRIVPFWVDVLAALRIEPLFFLCVRNPQEVAASLEKRNGLDRSVSQMIWLCHVLEAEHATRGMPRYISSYDRLLRDWRGIAEESARTFDIAWPRPVEQAAPDIDAFLSEKHRHHWERSVVTSDDSKRSRWLEDSYGILERWAETGEDAKEHARLDRIRQEFDAACGRSCGTERRRALGRLDDGWRGIARRRIGPLREMEPRMGPALTLEGYDFIDFGCSKGGSLNAGSQVFGGRGIGIDIDPAKVAAARAAGFEGVTMDAQNLDPSALGTVRFALMIHFLEHLPGIETAEACIRSACRIAREFVFIRQPYFDADGRLFEAGLKFNWSDWTGHPNQMTSLEFHNILRRLFAEGLVTRFVLGFRTPLYDSSAPEIHSIASPRDQHEWKPGIHPPKPELSFSPPVYRETYAIIFCSDHAVHPILRSYERRLKVVFDSATEL